jgi:hypothetical protein
VVVQEKPEEVYDAVVAPLRTMEPEMPPAEEATLSLERPAETEKVWVLDPAVRVTVAASVQRTTA